MGAPRHSSTDRMRHRTACASLGKRGWEFPQKGLGCIKRLLVALEVVRILGVCQAGWSNTDQCPDLCQPWVIVPAKGYRERCRSYDRPPEQIISGPAQPAQRSYLHVCGGAEQVVPAQALPRWGFLAGLAANLSLPLDFSLPNLLSLGFLSLNLPSLNLVLFGRASAGLSLRG